MAQLGGTDAAADVRGSETGAPDVPADLLAHVRRGMIPAHIYNDRDVFELERERVFGRAWLLLGHESEIPAPGDYVVRRVLQDSFILTDDADLAQRAARGVVLRFARHSSAARLFAEHDPGNRMADVRAALAAGDLTGATAAVPQPVADAFVVHGPARVCRERVAEYAAAGPDLAVVQPMPVQGTWDDVIEGMIRDLGPAAAQPG